MSGLEKEVRAVLQMLAEMPEAERTRFLESVRMISDLAQQRSGDMPPDLAEAVLDLGKKLIFSYVLRGPERTFAVFKRVAEDAGGAQKMLGALGLDVGAIEAGK